MLKKKFIFEDNPFVATSVMLQQSTEFQFLFSGGNKVPVKFDGTLLLDVVPDNPATVKTYLDYVDTDLTVIPIPCIEYFIIRAFIGYNDFTNPILRYLPYRNFGYKARSFEKACKLVLSTHYKCLKPKVEVVKNFFAYCNCTQCNQQYKIQDNDIKLRKLLLSLPMLWNSFDSKKYYRNYSKFFKCYLEYGYCTKQQNIVEYVASIFNEKS